MRETLDFSRIQQYAISRIQQYAKELWQEPPPTEIVFLKKIHFGIQLCFFGSDKLFSYTAVRFVIFCFGWKRLILISPIEKYLIGQD